MTLAHLTSQEFPLLVALVSAAVGAGVALGVRLVLSRLSRSRR